MPEGALRGIQNTMDSRRLLQFGSTDGFGPTQYWFEPGEVKILALNDKDLDFAVSRVAIVNVTHPVTQAPFATERLIFKQIPLADAMSKVKLEDKPEVTQAKRETERKEAERKAIAAEVIEELRKQGRLKEAEEAPVAHRGKR